MQQLQQNLDTGYFHIIKTSQNQRVDSSGSLPKYHHQGITGFANFQERLLNSHLKRDATISAHEGSAALRNRVQHLSLKNIDTHIYKWPQQQPVVQSTRITYESGLDIPSLDPEARNVNNVLKPQMKEFQADEEVTYQKLKQNKIKQLLLNYQKNPHLSAVPKIKPNNVLKQKIEKPSKNNTKKLFLSNDSCKVSDENPQQIYVSIKKNVQMGSQAGFSSIGGSSPGFKQIIEGFSPGIKDGLSPGLKQQRVMFGDQSSFGSIYSVDQQQSVTYTDKMHLVPASTKVQSRVLRTAGGFSNEVTPMGRPIIVKQFQQSMVSLSKSNDNSSVSSRVLPSSSVVLSEFKQINQQKNLSNYQGIKKSYLQLQKPRPTLGNKKYAQKDEKLPMPAMRFNFMGQSKEKEFFSKEIALKADSQPISRLSRDSSHQRNQSSKSALVKINEEYQVLHSMSSQEDLEDNFQFKTREDPDIPHTETNQVKACFPFVKSLDFTKPIDTRLRTTIRTNKDFDSVEKLKEVKKLENPYKVGKNLRKNTKGQFKDQEQVQKLMSNNDAEMQKKSLQILEKNNPNLIERKEQEKRNYQKFKDNKSRINKYLMAKERNMVHQDKLLQFQKYVLPQI